MSDQKILKKVGFLVAARDLAVEYGEETKLNEVMSGLQAELAGKAWICSSCGQVFLHHERPRDWQLVPGGRVCPRCAPALEIATRPRRELSARMGG